MMDYPRNLIIDNFCRKEFLPWIYHIIRYNLTHSKHNGYFPWDAVINYRDWFYWFNWDGNDWRFRGKM